MPQAEPLGSARFRFRESHGQQYVRGPGNSGGAGRAGGGFHTGQIQEEKQRVTFAAREGEMRVAGEAACAVLVVARPAPDGVRSEEHTAENHSQGVIGFCGLWV